MTRAIIVHGQPVRFPMEPGPSTSPLAHAVYEHGNDHVPVWLHVNSGMGQDEIPRLHGDAEPIFDIQNEAGDGPVTTASAITARYTLEDGSEHSVQSDFHAAVHSERPRICISQQAKNRGDLPQAAAQAYCLPECTNLDQEEMDRGVEILVMQALQGRTKAFTEALRELANSFSPHSTRPEESVTVRSTDGSITITSQANPDCRNCGQPRSQCPDRGRVCRLHGVCSCIECKHSPPGTPQLRRNIPKGP